jgi:hypothetical protein
MDVTILKLAIGRAKNSQAEDILPLCSVSQAFSLPYRLRAVRLSCVHETRRSLV